MKQELGPRTPNARRVKGELESQTSSVAKKEQKPKAERKNIARIKDEASPEPQRSRQVRRERTETLQPDASISATMKREGAPRTPSKKNSAQSQAREALTPSRSVERRCSQCRQLGHDIRNCLRGNNRRDRRQQQSQELSISMSTSTTVYGASANMMDVTAQLGFGLSQTASTTPFQEEDQSEQRSRRASGEASAEERASEKRIKKTLSSPVRARAWRS